MIIIDVFATTVGYSVPGERPDFLCEWDEPDLGSMVEQIWAGFCTGADLHMVETESEE